MFPCSCPTFSYQYSQKISLTRQLSGTINQEVKLPNQDLNDKGRQANIPRFLSSPRLLSKFSLPKL